MQRENTESAIFLGEKAAGVIVDQVENAGGRVLLARLGSS